MLARMGVMHRIVANAPAEVWETQTRLLHALGRVPAPTAVQWMVTAACDLHCPHCYAAAGRRRPHELTTEEALRLVVDEVADMGCPLLVLAGGELLLRRDIAEIVEHARRRGLDWAMHTHGGHVPRLRALFERHPPVLAAVSLDGDRSTHDAFRGRAGSFDAALAAVRVLVETGCPEVVLGTTVTSENADRLVDLFPTVARSGAHSWGLHLFAPAGRGEQHRALVPTPAQLRRVAALARRRRAVFPVELCNEWESAGADDPHYRDRPLLCGAGRISCVIGPTGDVLPCTTTDPTAREGNVRERPLRAIWRDGFAGFRTGHDPVVHDGRRCWLQARAGVRIGPDAFGPVAQAESVADRLPPRLLSLAHAVLRPRKHAPRAGLASDRSVRAARAAAVGLAFLGACTRTPAPTGPAADDAANREPPDDTTPMTEAGARPAPTVAVAGFPPALDEAGIQRSATWTAPGALPSVLVDVLAAENGRGRWPDPDAAGLALSVLPGDTGGAFAVALREHLRHAAAGEASTVTALLDVLDAAETIPVYNAALAGHLWRAAEQSRDASSDADALERRALFYARLHRHQRLAAALAVARATAGTLQPRPWLKKSAPPPGWGRGGADLSELARRAFDEHDAGPWDRVGLAVRLEPGPDAPPPRLVRDGRTVTLSPDRTFRWLRLDLLLVDATTTVRIDPGFAVAFSAGTTATLRTLGGSLGPVDEGKLDRMAQAALTGDADALVDIERLLPLAHESVRAALRADPEAPGAPALRTLLVVFDE